MELELKENNLYVTGTLYNFELSDEQLLLRETLVIIRSELDKYHTVRYTDRLDRLAYEYWKDFIEDASKYWGIIADANEIYNPLDLSEWIGKDIVIPDIIRVRLSIYESSDS